jgi:hypothetical protein
MIIPTMKMLPELTILIQGRVLQKQFDLWVENYSNYNVVISTWEDCDVDFKNIPSDWKLKKSSYPIFRFAEKANLDYQIITTLSGLDMVETDWVIKVRGDEYWSNIDLIFEKMQESPDKIVCSSIFFRPFGLYKFHISDHIIGGYVSNLHEMFNATLENLKKNIMQSDVPECQLGFAYVLSKENGLPQYADLQISLNKDENDVFKASDSVRMVNTALDIVVKNSMQIVSKDLNVFNVNKIDWRNVLEMLGQIRSIVDSTNLVINRNYAPPIQDEMYIKKWFSIINVNELKPYIATYNSENGRVWYNSDFDNENCLTKL